jgi:hypothetical protein
VTITLPNPDNEFNEEGGGNMRFTVAVVLAISILPTVASSQKTVGAFPTKAGYYDTFNQPWIDPVKWQAVGPWCAQGTTLECVREIQDGRLRLEIRNMGMTNSDAGFQFGESPLVFTNPSSIFSITADVQLGRVNVVGCPTNLTDQPTRALAGINGTFFNTGSLDQADDVSDFVTFWVDASNPKSLQVINWLSGSGLGVATPIASYPIETPLTVTNTWDKAHHRFITVVAVAGEPDSATKVIIPYSVSDSALPVVPYRQLTSSAYSLNCTSIQTFAEMEIFWDNVKINNPPPFNQ